MCSADMNKNDINIEKFYKLLDIFADDILLWAMNKKEKNDYSKNNKTIPNILFCQVKHYIKKYGDLDIEIFLANPPNSMKPR
jgi:succinate dehydrogenase flavin-adding protein (antitoxin of CptAB toxin-antitoxin module)